MRASAARYGKCFLCGGTFPKRAIARHLKACLPAHPSPGRGKPVRLLHLQAEGKYAPEYWLHLEIPADATLADLDAFLRAIWLECCDHLSAFTIKDQEYEYGYEDEDDDEDEHEHETDLDMLGALLDEHETDLGMLAPLLKKLLAQQKMPKSMNRKLSSVLSPGDTFIHEYDFGTTTTLKLKVVGELQGLPPKKGVRVLARNYAPFIPCSVCGERAVYINTFDWPTKTYCEAHADTDEEYDKEELLPVVNSPRMGQCGYDGPWNKSLLFEETSPLSEEQP